MPNWETSSAEGRRGWLSACRTSTDFIARIARIAHITSSMQRRSWSGLGASKGPINSEPSREQPTAPRVLAQLSSSLPQNELGKRTDLPSKTLQANRRSGATASSSQMTIQTCTVLNKSSFDYLRGLGAIAIGRKLHIRLGSWDAQPVES
ncbi:hypothetical protein VCV18_002447 [Metarhizium anisopliae]